MNPIKLLACLTLATQILAAPLVSRAVAINVVTPTQGASWVAGQTNTITWNTEASNDSVDIALAQGDQQVQSIVQGLSAAQGSYVWQVPADLAAGDNYKVTFTSNGAAIASSAAFSVTDKATSSVNEIPPPSAAAAGNHWTATANITITRPGHPDVVSQQGPDTDPNVKSQSTSAAAPLTRASALSSLVLVASLFVYAF
ncbi:hypothetical protein BC940DRAFT_300285 [Gongronella butleri]|nr:hypothetical protein BC940DRAFT_300285 [Gongronella butleri]